MEHIFYFLAIFAILYEMTILYKPSQLLMLTKSIKKKGKDKLPYSDTENALIFTSLLYFMWLFIGLFSSQWYLFIILLFLGFIPKRYQLQIIIDAIISLGMLFFILINKYYLHLDLYNLIFG